MVALFAVLWTLAIMQPNGSVKLYATFPMGGTQMSVLELDTGKTWMIRESGVHGNAGQIPVLSLSKGSIMTAVRFTSGTPPMALEGVAIRNERRP